MGRTVIGRDRGRRGHDDWRGKVEIAVNTAATKQYHARLQRVLHHIDAHLEDDLSVETLSAVAAFSKYHFHRQFSELFGVSVYKYVQLARLKRASYRLAFRDDLSVTQIALDSGYEGPEAFSRAFRQRLGQTPSAFRRHPEWTAWHAAYRPISETRIAHMKQTITDDQVTIVDVQDTRVAVLEHRGDPALIGDSVRAFIAWRKSVRLPPWISATYNILYDNPHETAPEAFRLDLCAATEMGVAGNDAGIVVKVIPGGRCAVLRYTGSDDGLGDAVFYLYADWLPRSGEEPRDFPLYCQRVSFFPDVAEHEAVTDIFLPLK
jgi:AraC family transcriptional regulator